MFDHLLAHISDDKRPKLESLISQIKQTNLSTQFNGTNPKAGAYESHSGMASVEWDIMAVSPDDLEVVSMIVAYANKTIVINQWLIGGLITATQFKEERSSLDNRTVKILEKFLKV